MTLTDFDPDEGVTRMTPKERLAPACPSCGANWMQETQSIKDGSVPYMECGRCGYVEEIES